MRGLIYSILGGALALSVGCRTFPGISEDYLNQSYLHLDSQKFDYDYLQDQYFIAKKLKNNKGRKVFSSDNEIVKFNFTHMSYEDAVFLSNRGYDGFEIYRLAQLEIPLGEILEPKDSEKPNGLFIYPKEHNHGFDYDFSWGTTAKNDFFENKYSVAFFSELRKFYDLQVAFAEEERDVYKALSKSKDLSLLVVGGHGNFSGLMLGSGDEEKYHIDFTDRTFLRYFKKLKDNAVVFLYGCEAADPTYGENFAKFCSEAANKINKERSSNVRVIASTHSFGGGNLKIVNHNPLDVRIFLPKNTINNPTDKDIDATFSNLALK